MTSIPTLFHKELELALKAYYNLVFPQFLKHSTEHKICLFLYMDYVYVLCNTKCPNTLLEVNSDQKRKALGWKWVENEKISMPILIKTVNKNRAEFHFLLLLSPFLPSERCWPENVKISWETRTLLRIGPKLEAGKA